MLVVEGVFRAGTWATRDTEVPVRAGICFTRVGFLAEWDGEASFYGSLVFMLVASRLELGYKREYIPQKQELPKPKLA